MTAEQTQRLPPGFKHVALDFADRFAAGAVRIGTFEYYRAMEGDRRDPLEGLTLDIFNKTIGNEGPAKRDNEILGLIGFEVLGGQRIKISNVHVYDEVPSPYIFCCSIEADYPLAERDGLAIFAIIDLIGFGKAVVEAAGGNFGKRWGFSEVTYSPRVGNPFESGHLLQADPLVKDPKFAAEREIRFLFEPNGPPKAPYLDLHVPAIGAFIHRLL